MRPARSRTIPGISTQGFNSHGIFAQSVGGGGGSGGVLVSAATGPSSTGGTGKQQQRGFEHLDVRLHHDGVALAVGLGGSGSAGGSGDTVQVTSTTCKISTQGANAAGIFAQSVGGGGGAGGASTVNASNSSYALAFGLGGSGGGGGAGGEVTVNAMRQSPPAAFRPMACWRSPWRRRWNGGAATSGASGGLTPPSAWRSAAVPAVARPAPP